MTFTVYSSSSSLRITVATLISVVLIVTTCVPFSGAARSSSFKRRNSRSIQSAAPHREGELLVRFRPGVSQQDKESIIAAHGGRKKKDLSAESGVEKLELVNGSDEQTVALQMLLEPQVEFAEPNFLIAKDDLIPNDVQFNEQWSLRNTGQNGGQFGSDISAAGAWTTTTGSRSTVIAIVDSG
jgi:fervidolysin-like protein